MKMKYIIFFLLLIFISQTGFGQFSFFDVLDATKLPQEKEFTADFQWIISNQSLIHNAGNSKDSPMSKEEAISKLNKILEHTNGYIAKNKNNIDLLLFRVLVHWSFYSINLSGHADDIIAECLKIEALFPKEYRAYWFLGSFYASAARPLDSIKQFDYVIKDIRQETLHPQFWYGYASAAGFADMPKHSLEALKKYALLDKQFKMENDIVYKTSNPFISPTFETLIYPGSLFQVQERENGFGLLCRLFGIYMPVKKTWDVQTFNMKDNGTVLMLTPEAIPNKKKLDIKYSIAVEFAANNKGSYENFIKAHLAGFTTSKKKEMAIGDYSFSVYELTEPGMYKEMGGFHGYYVFLQRKAPSLKGLVIEAPMISMFDKATGKPYYRTPEVYDRYDGEIYYAVVLDCCGDIIEKAFPVFRDFIKNIIYD